MDWEFWRQVADRPRLRRALMREAALTAAMVLAIAATYGAVALVASR